MINFHIISIFPQMVENYTNESILKKAKEKGLINFYFYNIRDYTKDKHHKVDDKPYGGGPGMVMNAEPILLCVQDIKSKIKNLKKSKIIFLSPGGKVWNNQNAKAYAKKYQDIIFICGRYEGIDYRVQKILKPEIVSIGDFILTGGELPTMLIIDTISRQIDGVLGDINSLEENRNASDEFYTRPEILNWNGKNYKVPKVFLSGNPKLIEEYKNSKKK